MLRMNCRSCGKPIVFTVSDEGKYIACPHCGQRQIASWREDPAPGEPTKPATPERGPLVQRLLDASASLPEFLNDLLMTQAVIVAGTEAAAFLVERQGEPPILRPVAHVRPDASDQATRQAALQAFQNIVQPCIEQGKDGAIEVGSPDGGEMQFCLVTVLRGEGVVDGATAVITRARDTDRAKQRLQSMQLVAGYYEIHAMRREAQAAVPQARSGERMRSTETSRPASSAGMITRLLCILAAACGCLAIWGAIDGAVRFARSDGFSEPYDALVLLLDAPILGFGVIGVAAAARAWSLRSEMAVRWVCGTVMVAACLAGSMVLEPLSRLAGVEERMRGLGALLALAFLGLLAHGLLSRRLLKELGLVSGSVLARRPLVGRTALRLLCFVLFGLLVIPLGELKAREAWAPEFGLLAAAAIALSLYGILVWLTRPRVRGAAPAR